MTSSHTLPKSLNPYGEVQGRGTAEQRAMAASDDEDDAFWRCVRMLPSGSHPSSATQCGLRRRGLCRPATEPKTPQGRERPLLASRVGQLGPERLEREREEERASTEAGAGARGKPREAPAFLGLKRA